MGAVSGKAFRGENLQEQSTAENLGQPLGAWRALQVVQRRSPEAVAEALGGRSRMAVNARLKGLDFILRREGERVARAELYFRKINLPAITSWYEVGTAVRQPV